MPAKLLKWPNKQKMTKKEEINKKYNIQKKIEKPDKESRDDKQKLQKLVRALENKKFPVKVTELAAVCIMNPLVHTMYFQKFIIK